MVFLVSMAAKHIVHIPRVLKQCSVNKNIHSTFCTKILYILSNANKLLYLQDPLKLHILMSGILPHYLFTYRTIYASKASL